MDRLLFNKQAISLNKFYLYAIIFFELIILYVYSPNTGDYENYKLLIDEYYPNMGFIELIKQDPVFGLLTLVIKSFGLSLRNIIFLISGVSIFIKNNIFYKYKSFFILSTLYFSSLFWIHELIQIRTALATTFILIGWQFYFARKKYAYSIFYLLACLTHLSTFLFIFFNFFKNIKLKYIYIYTIITCILMGIYSYYIEDVTILFNGIERINRYHEDSNLNNVYLNDFKIISVLNLIDFWMIIEIGYMWRYLKGTLNFFKITPFIMFFTIVLFRNFDVSVIPIRILQIYLFPLLIIISEILVYKTKLVRFLYLIILIPLFLYNYPYRNYFVFYGY